MAYNRFNCCCGGCVLCIDTFARPDTSDPEELGGCGYEVLNGSFEILGGKLRGEGWLSHRLTSPRPFVKVVLADMVPGDKVTIRVDERVAVFEMLASNYNGIHIVISIDDDIVTTIPDSADPGPRVLWFALYDRYTRFADDGDPRPFEMPYDGLMMVVGAATGYYEDFPFTYSQTMGSKRYAGHLPAAYNTAVVTHQVSDITKIEYHQTTSGTNDYGSGQDDTTIGVEPFCRSMRVGCGTPGFIIPTAAMEFGTLVPFGGDPWAPSARSLYSEAFPGNFGGTITGVETEGTGSLRLNNRSPLELTARNQACGALVRSNGPNFKVSFTLTIGGVPFIKTYEKISSTEIRHTVDVNGVTYWDENFVYPTPVDSGSWDSDGLLQPREYYALNFSYCLGQNRVAFYHITSGGVNPFPGGGGSGGGRVTQVSIPYTIPLGVLVTAELTVHASSGNTLVTASGAGGVPEWEDFEPGGDACDYCMGELSCGSLPSSELMLTLSTGDVFIMTPVPGTPSTWEFRQDDYCDYDGDLQNVNIRVWFSTGRTLGRQDVWLDGSIGPDIWFGGPPPDPFPHTGTFTMVGEASKTAASQTTEAQRREFCSQIFPWNTIAMTTSGTARCLSGTPTTFSLEFV